MAKSDARYVNSGDVQLRLNQCIAFYRGCPYLLLPVENTTNVKLGAVYRGHEAPDLNKVVSANDPELDTSSPELGWFEYENNFYYAARAPVRRQKQGISRDNVSIFLGEKDLMRNAGIGTLLFTKGFYKMLLNDYQTLPDSISRIRRAKALVSSDVYGDQNDAKRVAFSKKFAIEKRDDVSYFLRFGTRVVGAFDENFVLRLNPMSDNSLMRMRLVEEGVNFL